MALPLVVGNGFSVDQDDLEVLLVNPDTTLKIALSFFEDLGTCAEDVGVDLVDMLTAEVGNVVLGQVFGGENKGQSVLDVLKVGGRHHHAFKRVLRGEDNVF